MCADRTVSLIVHDMRRTERLNQLFQKMYMYLHTGDHSLFPVSHMKIVKTQSNPGNIMTFMIVFCKETIPTSDQVKIKQSNND